MPNEKVLAFKLKVAKQAARLNNKRKKRTQDAGTNSKVTVSELLNAIDALLEIVAAEAIQICIPANELHKKIDRALVLAALKTRVNIKAKPNRSQIAAQTGLSRPEVSQLIETPTQELAKKPNKIIQTHTYIANNFSTKRSKRQLIRLPFYGSTRSFSAAVKSVGGDIPPAAMLKEFVRRKIARVAMTRTKTTIIEIKSSVDVSPETTNPSIQLAFGLRNILQTSKPNELAAAHISQVNCQSMLRARQFVARIESKLPAFIESLDAHGVDIQTKTRRGALGTTQNLQVAILYWQGK